MTLTPTHRFDVVLIGSGLAATAAARAVALQGRSVAFIPGVARSRSLEQDGGVIDPALVARAFGPGAPLGSPVDSLVRFRAATLGDSPDYAAAEPMAACRAFRRLDLERWAQAQAKAAGAEFLDDFVEGKVLPAPDGSALLTEEHGERVLTANVVALCEGADPRIPMGVGLRPDYLPEEQVHFARTIVRGAGAGAAWRQGRCTTSWEMPIGIDVIPLGDDAIVSVSARIENIMRSERSSMDALEDLLSSPMAAALGTTGEREGSGMELVALRRNANVAHLTHDRLVLGLDAAGVIDPREPSRADATLRSGLVLGAWLADPDGEAWDTVATPLLQEIRATHPGWRENREAGYIDDVDGSSTLANAARSIIGRFRRREQEPG